VVGRRDGWIGGRRGGRKGIQGGSRGFVESNSIEPEALRAGGWVGGWVAGWLGGWVGGGRGQGGSIGFDFARVGDKEDKGGVKVYEAYQVKQKEKNYVVFYFAGKRKTFPSYL
jgi:hypothetical protein